MNKSELEVWLQEHNRQWEALLDEIGPARMELPGVNGDWSMKDLVAHLTGWHRRFANEFQAVQRGEPEPPPPWPADLQTEDEINAWIYESNRARSLNQVLEETHQVLQQVANTVQALPDDVRIEKVEPVFYLVWVNDKRYPVAEFYDHFRDDHLPDVRAWLARQQ